MTALAPLRPELTPDIPLTQVLPQTPVSRPSRLVREPLRRPVLGVDTKASARDPRVPCDVCGKRPSDVIVGTHLDPSARWLCWQCQGRRRDHLPVIGTVHRARDDGQGETRDAYLARLWTVNGRMVRHGEGERYIENKEGPASPAHWLVS